MKIVIHISWITKIKIRVDENSSYPFYSSCKQIVPTRCLCYFLLMGGFVFTFAVLAVGFLLAALTFAIFLPPPPILNIFVPHTVHIPEIAP